MCYTFGVKFKFRRYISKFIVENGVTNTCPLTLFCLYYPISQFNETKIEKKVAVRVYIILQENTILIMLGHIVFVLSLLISFQ